MTSGRQTPRTNAPAAPPHLSVQGDGVRLSIKLQPRASANEVCEAIGHELKIKVTAPPVDAAANQALVDLLAEILNCPRSRIEIIRGHTSRHKAVMLHGCKLAEVATALAAKSSG